MFYYVKNKYGIPVFESENLEDVVNHAAIYSLEKHTTADVYERGPCGYNRKTHSFKESIDLGGDPRPLTNEMIERMEGLVNVRDIVVLSDVVSAIIEDLKKNGFEKDDILAYLNKLIARGE